MSKHHPDLIMCRKQPGIAVGRVCETCDGRCVVCNAPGVSDAYYCKECVMLEKDRDGCPKIVNIGSAKTDRFYERKKYEFSSEF